MPNRDDIARAAREQLAEEVLLLLLGAVRDFLDGKAKFVITGNMQSDTRTISFKREPSR